MLSSSPLMTDLCWGWGSELSRGSAARRPVKLCKLSPRQASLPLGPLGSGGRRFTSFRPEKRYISEEISSPSTVQKKRLAQRSLTEKQRRSCMWMPLHTRAGPLENAAIYYFIFSSKCRHKVTTRRNQLQCHCSPKDV